MPPLGYPSNPAYIASWFHLNGAKQMNWKKSLSEPRKTHVDSVVSGEVQTTEVTWSATIGMTQPNCGNENVGEACNQTAAASRRGGGAGRRDAACSLGPSRK
mmetsp:Transcript_20058/g.49143  ORF Transcript_20058/g.49143 Transcript_20058/m.49143 type:complete len:102 (+) Transcript_20058:988-1293(+)